MLSLSRSYMKLYEEQKWQCVSMQQDQLSSVTQSWNEINLLWRQKLGKVRLINHSSGNLQGTDVFSICASLLSVCLQVYKSSLIWSSFIAFNAVPMFLWFLISVNCVGFVQSSKLVCFERKLECSASNVVQDLIKPLRCRAIWEQHYDPYAYVSCQ